MHGEMRQARFQKAGWFREIIYALVLALLSFVVSTLDFFNIGELTDFASRDIFYRAWGVDYPAQSKARSTVVLLSDKSLGSTGSWPAPYETHAAFLRSLLPLQPAAVMIDIGFPDERDDETIANLVEVLRDYHEKKIPVFLAAATRASGANRVVRKELQQLASKGIIELVSIEVGKERGRLNLYPLSADAEHFKPAAEAIYENLCKSGTLKACSTLPRVGDFEVWWGALPDPLNCEPPGRGLNLCAQISPNPIVRLSRLAWNGFAGGYDQIKVDELDPVSVPFTPTISWDSVIAGTLNLKLRNHIRGSVIFYGLDLALINDEVYSPVHGHGDRHTVPGVFYHAMAYDNLVTLGDRLISPDPPFGVSESFQKAGVIVVSCIFFLFVRFSCLMLGVWRLADFLDLTLFAAFALAIAYAEFWHFHVSPANWVGLVLSMVLLKFEKLQDGAKALFYKFAFGRQSPSHD